MSLRRVGSSLSDRAVLAVLLTLAPETAAITASAAAASRVAATQRAIMFTCGTMKSAAKTDGSHGNGTARAVR